MFMIGIIICFFCSVYDYGSCLFHSSLQAGHFYHGFPASCCHSYRVLIHLHRHFLLYFLLLWQAFVSKFPQDLQELMKLTFKTTEFPLINQIKISDKDLISCVSLYWSNQRLQCMLGEVLNWMYSSLTSYFLLLVWIKCCREWNPAN